MRWPRFGPAAPPGMLLPGLALPSAAAGGGYTPPTGATAALLHIRPADYADIDSVVDVSGATPGTFVKGASPTLTTGIGSYPCIDFDGGTSDKLTLAAVPFESLGSGKTVYVVSDHDNAASYGYPFTVDNGTDYCLCLWNILGPGYVTQVGAPTVTSGYTAAITTATLNVAAFEFLDAGSKAYRNGTAGSAGAASTPDLSGGTPRTELGGVAWGLAFSGRIYEVFVDDAPYSSTLNATLMTAYGL